MISALILFGGALALVYVVRQTRPDAVEIALVAAVSGLATLWFVSARRAAALAAGAPRGWISELLAVGAPLPDSAYHGLERVPALALWMVACAAFLFSDGDDDEERGPAILALIPPVLVVALLLFGPATEHGGHTAAVTMALIAAVLAVVLVVRVVGRRLRGARRRD